MGTWSVDAFGNDDACDWAYGLEECKDLSLIERTVDKALSNDSYLEAPDGAEALAAIEVIARLQGHWGERTAYTETADAWAEKIKLTPSASLVEKAHRVIDLVLSDQSELCELWQQSDEFDDWQNGVLDLKSRVHA